MQAWEKDFQNKKVTIMGLGLLGRGLNVVRFFAKCGADIIVTDLKSKEALASSLLQLKDFPSITYVLGEHRFEDFRNRDLIIKAAGVPLDSPYTEEARQSGIPIKMDASLMFEYLPKGVTTIGITGTRGKSTTTHAIYEILKCDGRRVHLGGNVRGIASLPLLEEIQEGDTVVMELDSWQLQGFGEAKISPHIAVFTTFFDDHLNYYKGDRDAYLRDKSYIFAHQYADDHLVMSPHVAHLLEEKGYTVPSKTHIVDHSHLSESCASPLFGEHNRDNLACAQEVSRIVGVSESVIRECLLKLTPVPGRLERIAIHNGVLIYNDTCATTPDATIAALRALGSSGTKNTILMFGGADKMLDMDPLLRIIPEYVKALVVLEGTGSARISTSLHQFEKQGMPLAFATSMEEGVKAALRYGKPGDQILLSPDFASFGMFKNEYDRGDQFNGLVRSLTQ